MEQGVPALSHGDEIQRRHRKIHIPTVNPAVPEFPIVQILHFVDPALHLLAAGHGLGGHGFYRQIHQPLVVFYDQLTRVFKPFVCHGEIVVVLDLLPVNDEREVIAAVLEVVADIPAVKVPVPGEDLLEAHPSLLLGKAIHKFIRKAGRQRPQGIFFDLRGRDILVLHILLQDFPLVQQLLGRSFPGSGQHRLSPLYTLHQRQLVQAVQDMCQGGFRLIQISGGVGHRPLFRFRFQKI